MKNTIKLFFAALLSLCVITPVLATKAVYCDTSAGRLVLDNGYFSQSYCRNTAVMDLQDVHDCCTWHGGILLVRLGQVVCRDGSLSPVCSIQEEKDTKYLYSDDSVDINQSNFLK